MSSLFHNFKQAMIDKVGHWRGTEKAAAPKQRKMVGSQKALVKNRPTTLEQRYALVEEKSEVLHSFDRLKRQVYAAVEITARLHPKEQTIFKESGKIADGRPYFYIKPAGETGFLFECNPKGWVISRADKIIHKNLFLRSGEVLDVVSLYSNTVRKGVPRVTSQRLNSELLAMTVYEQELLKDIGLGAVADMLSPRKIVEPSLNFNTT